MTDWVFGFTLLVVGMGGTLASLGLLSLLIAGLNRLFPRAHGTKSPGHQR